MLKQLLFHGGIALFSCTSVCSQVTFQETFGGPGIDYGYYIDQTLDSGYIIGGYTYSFGSGDRDVYLIRIDKNADTLWTKAYGGTNIDYAYVVLQTSDGGFIAGAHSESFGAGSHDIYIIKTDENGDTMWTKAYGGPTPDGVYSMQQTADDGYILASHTSSYGAGQHEVYLIKTDPNGNVSWTRTYGESGGDYLRSIDQTSDGGYIMVSESESFGAGGFDVYVIKTDSKGDLEWTRTYGGTGADYGYFIQQTSDDGYIIAGYTNSFGAGSFDAYLIRTDGNGDTLWTKTYGGSSADYAYSVQQTNDGGFILSGYSESFGTGGDVYVIRTDEQGDTLWTKVYGGPQSDRGWTIQQTFDKGYIIAGFTESFGAGNMDVYIIKIDSNGHSGCNERGTATIVSNTNTVVDTTATVVDSGVTVNTTETITSNTTTELDLLCDSQVVNSIRAISLDHAKVFPNPFDIATTIELKLAGDYELTFSLYNILGIEVTTRVSSSLSRESEDVRFVLHRDKLVPGIYFYKITTHNKTLDSGKIVLN